MASSFREITSSKKGFLAKVGVELGLKEQVGVHKRVRKIGQGNIHTYLKGNKPLHLNNEQGNAT